ncbi:DNA-binding protein [Scheffersomyces xylosifermentans]|uniref:DNA-binding protein n=1 Tax=Scheffersomyces xylosifermentans TaxID=1304137 RepID=UPI00315C5A97
MSFQTLNLDETFQQGSNSGSRTSATQARSPVKSPYTRVNRHKSTLFTYPEGNSIRFFISPQDPSRSHYQQQIVNNGGVLLEQEASGGNNPYVHLTRAPLMNKATINLQYIDDCIASGRLLDFSKYSFHNDFHIDTSLLNRGAGDVLVGVTAAAAAAAAAASYVNEDVAAAAAAVSATGDLAIGQEGGSGETGNIQPPRRVRGHNRFTKEKDEFILRQVRMNPKLRHSHRFYSDLAQEEILKGHTGNSVRSRFRKHLEPDLEYVYKVDDNGRVMKDEEGRKIKLSLSEFPETLKNKYDAKDDYLLVTEAKDYIFKHYGKQMDTKIILPYSFFNDLYRKEPKHTLHSWRDRYRKFITDGTIEEYIQYYENCKKENREAKPLVRVNATNTGNVQVRNLVGSNVRGEDEVSALDEEIGELKSSLIDDTLQPIKPPKLVNDLGEDDDEEENTELGVDIPDSVEVFEDAASQVLSQSQATQDEGPEDSAETQFDTQGAPVTYKYIDKSTTFDDMLTKRAYKSLDSGELLPKVNEVVKSGEPDAVRLFERLEKIGLSTALISHIIYSTSADLGLFSTYFEIFLRNLTIWLEDEEKTQPDYKALRVNNVGGIWNEKSDKKLGTPQEDDLLDVHSKSQIRRRKEFFRQLESQLDSE